MKKIFLSIICFCMFLSSFCFSEVKALDNVDYSDAIVYTTNDKG